MRWIGLVTAKSRLLEEFIPKRDDRGKTEERDAKQGDEKAWMASDRKKPALTNTGEANTSSPLDACIKVISRLRNGVLMQMDGSDMSEVPEEPRLFRT